MSQFSKTTRQYKNGKVTYVNTYPKERCKPSKGKSPKSQLKGIDAQNSIPPPTRTEVQNVTEPQITKITSATIQDFDNLIVSTSNETTFIAMTENREPVNANSLPDTIKSKVPNKGAIMDNSIKQVIKYKSGKKEKIYVISQSHDTLFYTLTEEPEIVRGIILEQVDTIYPSAKTKSPDAAKTEKLGRKGFILSIIGFIPIFGIPCAVLSVIYGIRSLVRIRHFPEKYKGKGFGIAGLIIGTLAIIFNIIILISIIISFPQGCSVPMN
jgi:hypothetical protein